MFARQLLLRRLKAPTFGKNQLKRPKALADFCLA